MRLHGTIHFTFLAESVAVMHPIISTHKNKINNHTKGIRKFIRWTPIVANNFSTKNQKRNIIQ